MRVLFTSTSGQGHFQPLVPLIHSFMERGDDVLVVAPEKLVETLALLDIPNRVGGQPSEADSNRVWSLFPTLSRLDASELVEKEWFAGLCLDAMSPTVDHVASEWRPDLVVRETCEYAGALAADRASIPFVQVGVSTAGAEANVLNEMVRSQLNARQADVTDRIFRSPYLTKFPPSLDPSPYPTTIRYRDFDDRITQPLPDWWPRRDGPLIYVTMGTQVTASDLGVKLLRLILDTIQGIDARVLVTTGPSTSPGELGEVASNVHVESWVDQSDVMSEVSLVICHGGSGTSFGALSAGVPLVFLPVFADQPTNARLIQGAGAGMVIGDGSLSADKNLLTLTEDASALGRAVRDLLRDPSYRESAQRLSREIHAADSPRSLAARLAGMI